MDLKVLDERENPFLDRKELKLEIFHLGEATPSKTKLIEEIASKYKVDRDCIVIDYIFTKKGMSSSIAKAKIYKEKPKVRGIKKEEVERKIESKPEEQKIEKEKEEKSETQTS